MKNVNSINPNDFEFTIFELITEDGDCNTAFCNHQLVKLYEKYKPSASFQARKYHLDKDLADDVLQDGIILLLNRIRDGRFEYNPEYGFKSFLYRTFQNLSMNMNKKYKIFQTDELNDSVNIYSEGLDYFEIYQEIEPDYDLEEQVGELLQENLGENASIVLYLALIQNKTNQEGASIMKYRNEGVFRKKKSKHLKDFRERITTRQKAELMRMAS